MGVWFPAGPHCLSEGFFKHCILFVTVKTQAASVNQCEAS